MHTGLYLHFKSDLIVLLKNSNAAALLCFITNKINMMPIDVIDMTVPYFTYFMSLYYDIFNWENK